MKLRSVLSTVFAIAAGFIVLAGTLFGHNADGTLNQLGKTQVVLLNWAIILAAVAVFVGVGNLLVVHTNKIRKKQTGLVYSIFLIFFLLLTLVVGLVPGQQGSVTAIFNSVQLPVEASLMALLAVTLTYASIRLLRQRLNLFAVIFIVTALLILFCTAPLPFIGDLFVISGVPLFSGYIRPFIAQVFASGGARGILLGVGLGTLTTGLRILFGTDRPYRENNG